MRPVTEEDIANLPSEYSVDADFREYLDAYGPHLRQAYAQTYIVFQYNSFYVPNVFNEVLFGTVGFMILVAVLIRINNHFGRRSAAQLPAPLRFIHNFTLKHLFYARSLGKDTMWGNGTWFSIHVPERIHGLAVFLYVAVNIILLFTPYWIIKPNIYWQDLGWTWNQYVRSFSDRTGIMAFGATPLIILLAGRNSIISTLTGATFATLQVYHRWVARIAVLHAVLHSLGFTAIEALYNYDYYLSEFTNPENQYWNYGVAATVGGSFIVALSARRIREKAYELFLLIHIALAVLWVVGCYYHVYYLEPEYYLLKWIYASIALWGFDRVVRFLRLVIINTPLFTKRRQSAFAAEAYVIRTGDFIRLRITTARTWPKALASPGTYVFISSPDRWIWQNHPFTISWPSDVPVPATLTPSTPSSIEDLKGAKIDTNAEDIFEASPMQEDSTSFELIVKVYNGWTQKFAKAINASNTVAGSEHQSAGVQRIKVLVEGPYGGSERLQGYSSILLVSGGSGVSATLSHLADLVKERGTLQHVAVVWAIRDPSACDVLAPYLYRLQKLYSEAPAGFLEIHIHITGVVEPSSEKASLDGIDPLEQVEKRFKQSAHSSVTSIKAHYARPDVEPYLAQVVTQNANKGKIAVSACGPYGLCDSAREAVKRRIGSVLDANQIEYHEETFTW